MAATLSHRRGGSADYIWPGYVDALTTLLMVLIFLLSLFSVAQFTLSNALSSRDNAIEQLGKQIGDLANALSPQMLRRERRNLAGTNDEHPSPMQATEDLPRERDRGVGGKGPRREPPVLRE